MLARKVAYKTVTFLTTLLLINLLEDCLVDIRKWLVLNKLTLNEDKSELLIILTSLQTHTCSLDSIAIGGCELKSSDRVRNLAVQFDSSM